MTRPKGQILIPIVIVIAAIVAIIGVTIAGVAYTNSIATGQRASGRTAEQAAQAGTDDALLRLARDKDFNTSGMPDTPACDVNEYPLALSTGGPFACVKVAQVAGSPVSQGPQDSPSIINDPSVGTKPWVCPSCAASDNGISATVNLDKLMPEALMSNYLNATNFGFSIPAAATITGILFEAKESCSGINPADIIAGFYGVLKGGTVYPQPVPSYGWECSGLYATYGSSIELWGTTWTPADINSATFGVVLSALNDGPAGSQANAEVDHIRVTIYYSDGSGVSASQHVITSRSEFATVMRELRTTVDVSSSGEVRIISREELTN